MTPDLSRFPGGELNSHTRGRFDGSTSLREPAIGHGHRSRTVSHPNAENRSKKLRCGLWFAPQPFAVQHDHYRLLIRMVKIAQSAVSASLGLR